MRVLSPGMTLKPDHKLARPAKHPVRGSLDAEFGNLHAPIRISSIPIPIMASPLDVNLTFDVGQGQVVKQRDPNPYSAAFLRDGAVST